MKNVIVKIILLFSLFQVITLIISSLMDDLMYDYMGVDVDFIFVIIIPTSIIFLWFAFYLKKNYKELDCWSFLILGTIISIISTHIYILIAIFYAYYGTYGVRLLYELSLNRLYSTYIVIIPYLVVMIVECLVVFTLLNKTFFKKR